MRSMPWFPPALIARVCPTKKPCAGSLKRAEPSSTPLLSGLSSPLRRRKCPLSSPPPGHRFPQPCRHLDLSLHWREVGPEAGIYPNEISIVSPLFLHPIFTLTRWDEPDWPSHD